MPTDLTRTVRFCLNADGSLAADAARANSYAAWPPMRGLGRYYELDVTCRGVVDPVTGYMVNIKLIDDAVRDGVLPAIAACAGDADPPLGKLLHQAARRLAVALTHPVVAVRLRLTPTYSITCEEAHMGVVTIRQRFDFSAAHRLHAPSLSSDENRTAFGKCNNPNGHGHNYGVEVAARCPIDDAGRVAPVEQLDQVVDREIIERFDHKHLNLDTEEFADLNPSVEHIARVFFERLVEPVRRIGLELAEVSVWETEKTVARYTAAG